MPHLPPAHEIINTYLDGLPPHTAFDQMHGLDLGSGEGRNAIALSKAGFEYVLGIDADEGEVMKARKYAKAARIGATALHYEHADALAIGNRVLLNSKESLPSKIAFQEPTRQHFDAVVCTEVMHFYGKGAQEGLLHNIRQRVAPGGAALVSGYMRTPDLKQLNTDVYNRLLADGELADSFRQFGWLIEVALKREHPVTYAASGKPSINARTMVIAKRPYNTNHGS